MQVATPTNDVTSLLVDAAKALEGPSPFSVPVVDHASALRGILSAQRDFELNRMAKFVPLAEQAAAAVSANLSGFMRHALTESVAAAAWMAKGQSTIGDDCGSEACMERARKLYKAGDAAMAMRVWRVAVVSYLWQDGGVDLSGVPNSNHKNGSLLRDLMICRIRQRKCEDMVRTVRSSCSACAH